MTSAFWDASAIVPLCVDEPTSRDASEFAERFAQTVWWATEVEVHSAITRLQRMGAISEEELAAGLFNLKILQMGWDEVPPSGRLRQLARNLLTRFPLRAADALQLAAAMIWSEGNPFEHVFLSADRRLCEAAAAVGFEVIALGS